MKRHPVASVTVYSAAARATAFAIQLAAVVSSQLQKVQPSHLAGIYFVARTVDRFPDHV